MTREELKAHCEKQVKLCEMWAKHRGEEPSGKIYEEHKLILELLEQEPCEDWYDVPSDEMTLEQARQAVKDLRQKLAECLEQEPCEDVISRQAVLDIAKNNGIYTIMGKAIKELPPISLQPKTVHWIPVSERLPEEAYGCIVTVMDTNPMTLEEFENIYPDFVGWDGENWNDADGDSIPFEVIAWMPLPESYKVESEE